MQGSVGSGPACGHSPGTGGGLGRAWSRPSGQAWFGFPGRCSGRPERRPAVAKVRFGRRVDTVLAREVQEASQGWWIGDSQRVKSQEVLSDSRSGVQEGWGPRAGNQEAGAEVGSCS